MNTTLTPAQLAGTECARPGCHCGGRDLAYADAELVMTIGGRQLRACTIPVRAAYGPATATGCDWCGQRDTDPIRPDDDGYAATYTPPPCGTCGGQGGYPETTPREDGSTTTVFRTCHTCHGTGRA